MFMRNSWIFYGSWFLEFLPARGVAQFYRTCRGSNLFPKSKVANLKILGFLPDWYLQGSKSGKDFWADLAKFTKVPLAIQFAHGRTSFDVLLLPLPPPSFQERHENFYESFTPYLLFARCKLFPLPSSHSLRSSLNWESALNSLYSHTVKSIHYFV